MFFARKLLNSKLFSQNRVSVGGIAVIKRLPAMRMFASSSPAAMFEKAVTYLKKMKNEPDDELKLQLYGLFKQASTGDVQGARPKMLEFVARAKYDAWSKNKGMATEEAQKQYTELVYGLLKQEGIDTSGGDGPGPGLAGNPQKPGNGNGADTIRVSKQGKVFKIELNRPDKFNAINWEMYQALIDAMDASNKCHQTSITVLTGNGNYYCAGNDLSNFMRNVKTPDDLRAMADRGEQVLERFVRAHIEHEKPLISLVNGPAIGISVTVLALFDLVVASSKASFHTPFSSLGQSPEGCSSYTFPMLMGASKACEILLFDRKLTAQEALECNMVSRVIPHDSFKMESERLVQKLSELPPESLRVNKQLLRAVHRDALLRVCTHECAVLKQRWLSEECQQALMNFRSRKGSKI